MESSSSLGLSKEAFNRVLIWEEALDSAYMYLVIGTHIREKKELFPDMLHYSSAGFVASADLSSNIWNGLTEAAVVLFRQVFSSGDGGIGISNNQTDPEIVKLRGEMKTFVCEHLNWTTNDYESVFRLVRDRRNEQVAHYDGKAANYQETILENGSITSRQKVGCGFGYIEHDRFKSMVGAMCYFIKIKLYNLQ
jgi:hypothetical protein